MREIEGADELVYAPSARESREAVNTIRPFLRFDRISACIGLVVILGAWVLGLREGGLLFFAAGSIAVLIVLLTMALQAISLDDVLRSLTLATVGNWLVAITIAWVVPQLWPVMIMTVLMPVVLATPFLKTRALVALLIGAAVVASLVSAAGLLNDDGGVVPDLADELELVLVISAVIALTIPIALIVRNNNELLQGRLQSLSSVNAELDRSRRELAASRRRVVEAGDAERRRIERNLHDGAQQRLVSLGVRLRLLDSITGPDHELNDNINALITEADEAIEELRRLAQGIYPPLLETSGLVPALQAAARRSGLSIDTDLADIGRLNTNHERALYFVALEALTNAAKYAPDAAVKLRLAQNPAGVELTVSDDGPGFDMAAADHRHGTHNMGDRVASVGGQLSIDSSPGHGTTVFARLPNHG